MQLIDEGAWERAEVVPIGELLIVTEWLAKVDRLGMTLAVLPPRRIAGGPYEGGWVVSADNERSHLYFAVPAAATALRGRIAVASNGASA